MPAPETAAPTQHDTPSRLPHNVPAQLTSLVGREREVAALSDLLRQDGPRLLTLTGAPGIGKTRLAIEVVNDLRGCFDDGIYFVNLAPVSEPDAAVQAVAAALGIMQIGDRSLEEVVGRYLSGRRVLLVLDNFEQVLAAGPAVTHVLKAAPGLKVLITSRELLSVSGEYGFPVPPLSMPPVLAPEGDSGRYTPLPTVHLGEYEAVQLFVQRAAAYRPGFVLDEENAHAIATICRKLDGLPLAIELAAARIRHLSPQAMLDRLQDRLALLTGGARDLPLRQRTLKATIEWSYSLLSEDEKRLFTRLGAFSGGRTLEAVEAVCDFDGRLGVDALNGIASLVDKSLLQQAAGPRTVEAADPRYVMLETIQEYARSKLEESGEAGALREAHANYFTQLAERAEPELRGARQVEWLDRLESEHDNLLAALGWAYHNDNVLGLRLVAALNLYWNRRGHVIEGRDWASAIVSRAREEGPEPNSGPPASRHLRGSVRASMARALYTLGFIAFRQAHYELARELLSESVQLYEQMQAQGESIKAADLAETLNVLGIALSRLENMDARRELHERALELSRQADDNWSIARSLYQLGHVARLTGDYALGRSLFEQSLGPFRDSGDKFNIGLALIGMGQMSQRQGDCQSAHRLFEESLAVYNELGDTWGIAGALYSLGCNYMDMKDYARARAALEGQLALAEQLGVTGDLAEAGEKLGKVAYYQGDYARAHQLYARSLSLAHSLGDKMGTAHCLIDLAGVAVAPVPERGSGGKGAAQAPMSHSVTTTAARLLAAAQTLLDTVGFQLSPDDRVLFGGHISTARADLGEQAFAKAWAEGQALDIARAVEMALALPEPEQQDAGEQVSPARRAAEPQPGGLTRREREVAALVSQGKSNRAIAEELVVSERTVEGHITNIFSKLGFHSRAQVAAWAVEMGLAQPRK